MSLPLKNFWDTGLSTAIILLIALGISGLPTWIPLFRKKTLPFTTYRFALYSTALSQAAQAYFILGVGTNAFPLSQSARYAAFGLPLCIVGAGLASFSLVSDRQGVGCLISAMFTGFLWLFLISLH
jgi:hypothetical protein